MKYKTSEYIREKTKKWQEDNPEKVKEYQREWREAHREENKEYQREYYIKNQERLKGKSKEYRKKNSEKCREYFKKLRKTEKYKKYNREQQRKYNKTEKRKKRVREWQKEKVRIDPKYRLNRNVASAIWLVLKENKAGRKWETLVGYTLQDLMRHLESLFESWMNWDNYGEWVIDHVRPISLFNFTLPEDKGFKECWALENLQPMEKIANIKKSNNY